MQGRPPSSPLDATEHQFQLLVDSVKDHAIYMLSPSGVVASWNAGAERLKGYRPGETIGQHFSRLYPAADVQAGACERALEEASRTGHFESEGWRVRKDGSSFWANAVISTIRGEAGELLGFAKVTRDLSARRRAEAQAILVEAGRVADEQRRLLTAVAESMTDGITVQDRSGRLVFANHGAARMVGFTTPSDLLAAAPSEVVGRFEMFAEDGSVFPAEQLPGRAVLAGRAGGAVLLRIRVRGTSEDRWSLVRATPVTDAAGQVLYAINAFTDVTLKRREEAQHAFLLRATEQLSSSLNYVDTLASVVKQVVPSLADWCALDIVVGHDLKRLAVAHVDPAKIALIHEMVRRYPPDPNAPGSPPHILKTCAPFMLKVIPRELLQERARDAEHLALIDSLQLHSYLGVPLVSGGRALGVLSLAMAESGRTYGDSDLLFASHFAARATAAIENARLFHVTERALARETEAKAAAEDALHFSDLFIGVLSHDLRNPLGAIALAAQLLQKGASSEQRRAMERIEKSAARMDRMIHQLLDLTRLRLGEGFKLGPVPTRLHELASQLREETEDALACTINQEESGNLDGVWDRDLLAQVLTNLLANAARHGSPGDPVRLALDGRQADAVVLEVRNAGSIPADVLPTIFDAFRGGPRRTNGGLGLGLYISREIVHAHGGSIEVHSTEEKGTTFRVTLPRHPPGPHEQAGHDLDAPTSPRRSTTAPGSARPT